jgi:hypothetical protein
MFSVCVLAYKSCAQEFGTTLKGFLYPFVLVRMKSLSEKTPTVSLIGSLNIIILHSKFFKDRERMAFQDTREMVVGQCKDIEVM